MHRLVLAYRDSGYDDDDEVRDFGNRGSRPQRGRAWVRSFDGDVLRAAREQGFREYVNPETGSGHGTDHFSW